MTQDEIIRMAREAGIETDWSFDFKIRLERFAALVAAHERDKQAEQEPFDMDDHQPHRLCECRKCMEYFTPLPDCDAFAASGKPIAEQTNTQLMEGYRIGLAEMREKCAKVCEEVGQDKNYHGIVAAIRAIKFEGDTGFRPVSEMIAEHKQDPKKAAAIEKAKMRKAEQKPVAWLWVSEHGSERLEWEPVEDTSKWKSTPLYAAPQPMHEPVAYALSHLMGLEFGSKYPMQETKEAAEQMAREHMGNVVVTPLYTHPVRTKDLTDDEIMKINVDTAGIVPTCDRQFHFARAVIAAYKEKNHV